MQPCVWRCAVLALMLAEVLVHADDTSLLLECPPPPADCNYVEESSRNEYVFNVSGHQISFDYRDGDFFAVTCATSLTLEDPGLPRFKKAVRVAKVTFDKCAPPINRSYAAVLATLNVTMFSNLILSSLPTAVLTREHLTDLQRLTQLELYSAPDADVSLAPGALVALNAAPALQSLTLHSVRTPTEDLTHLPPSLQYLKQWYVKADRIDCISLSNLTTLDVGENYIFTLNATNAITLKQLYVSSPGTVLPEKMLPPTLIDLELSGWNDTRPVPKTHCAQLQNLKVDGTANPMWPVSLPDEWVVSCGQLMDLKIMHVPLGGTVPARLLAHASALENLTIKYCNLNNLPPDLLDDAPRLKYLDLSYNCITALPSGLFLQTQSLQTLILSHNLLTSSVAGLLSGVNALKILRLNNNRHLGDLCPNGSEAILVKAVKSPLKSLTSLHYLYLSHTSVTRICQDWREDLINLRELDLKDTNITVLNLSELQFRRANARSKVFLKADKFKLQYTRDDYINAVNDQGSTNNQAKVTVEGSLIYDCHAYWTVMEFKRSYKLTSNVILSKYRNVKVDKIDLDTLTCNATEHCKSLMLPKNCSCGVREDLEHGSVVFVKCSAAGLTALPRLPVAKHKWRLHLAYNNITNITADQVSHIEDIVELDLRNNSIRRVDQEIAVKLVSIPLRLGGNRLQCDCKSYEMVSAMLGTHSHLLDKENVMCVNGSTLATAPQKPCMINPRDPAPHGFSNALAGALATLLIAAVATIVVLSRPAALQRVKTFLVWLGCMPPVPEHADDDRRYDVFVSYAHEDEEIVVERLAARLESGARPYKLCLHYRDWAPGEWIPAQIAASVRASRRTLAVVSHHYLESGWARAEFREATAASLRDGTPRLVVLLLEDPDGLALDPELNAYVRNNTYVRWGDPWFWEKLKQALPPPCSRQKKMAPSSLAPCPDIPLQHKGVTAENASATAATLTPNNCAV